ncbi:carbon storage regulator [Paenibacillus anaericanus]|nr:carbon storage regulator CsrA [Paenibacillus anaericanus]MDQ0089888.1 carbon storage regulator [Paenibacillus anaericanus]
MLVLKRKVGETVMIGDHIEVQIVSVEGDHVKLGFVAPKEVQILRQELYEGIVSENKNAGNQVGLQLQMIQILKEFKS